MGSGRGVWLLADYSYVAARWR